MVWIPNGRDTCSPGSVAERRRFIIFVFPSWPSKFLLNLQFGLIVTFFLYELSKIVFLIPQNYRTLNYQCSRIKLTNLKLIEKFSKIADSILLGCTRSSPFQ